MQRKHHHRKLIILKTLKELNCCVDIDNIIKKCGQELIDFPCYKQRWNQLYNKKNSIPYLIDPSTGLYGYKVFNPYDDYINSGFNIQ